ncbi:MAG: N4-gp56 family major capsid protein [Sarcina sp.]
MAQTKLSNMINPQVMADMISAELPHMIKFAPLAKQDNTLVEQAGNTITLPSFQYIGEATDVAEGVAMGTTVLTTSSKQATVKKAGKAVEITDEAVLSGYGDPVGEATKQLGMAIASKIDADCITALDTATLTYNGVSAAVSYNGVVEAIDKFEEEDYVPKVLFVHPKQITQLRKDPLFQDVNKYPLATIMTGVIGQIAGCQVIPSKRIKENTGGTGYVNYIVKAGALTIYNKRRAEVETDRDILAKTTVISADQHYTSVLSDESKVVKCEFKK